VSVRATPTGTNDRVYVLESNTAYNTVIDSVDVGKYPSGIAVNPDGKNIYVVNGDFYRKSGTCSVIDTNTNNVIATVNVGSYLDGIAVSLDGKKVYVTDIYNNIVHVIDTETNKVAANVEGGLGPNGVAITPDGKSIYVANWNSRDVSEIDTANNTVIATMNVEGLGNAEGVTVSPEGSKVYVNNSDTKGTISENETTTKNITKQIPEQRNNISILVKENKRTPGFNIASGIVCLLSVFLHKRR
jgi:YVTN family beta-propeller protein